MWVSSHMDTTPTPRVLTRDERFALVADKEKLIYWLAVKFAPIANMDVSDLAQDAILKLLNYENLRNETFSGLATFVVRNLAINHKARAKKHVANLSRGEFTKLTKRKKSETPDPETLALGGPLGVWFSTLSERDKIILQRLVDRVSHVEIAREVGFSRYDLEWRLAFLRKEIKRLNLRDG